MTGIQKRFLEQTELAYVNEVIAEMKAEIELYFLTAFYRFSTKIFEYYQRDNKLKHIEAGIFVDNNFVKDARPSFYLNASNNGMSKCC